MANHLESVRVQWSVTDEQFFRVVRDVFPPALLAGAGVLLASYDPEPTTSPAPPARRAPATADPNASAVAA
jgi:hypothetical protein